MRFLLLSFYLALTVNAPLLYAEQNINPELQLLKQQSLLLDRDLLVLEEKIKKPFSIYLSQKTDAKFVLENIVIKLDGQPLLEHKYNETERKALKRGGAQLLFNGSIPAGQHKLIAYYRSSKNYQGGAEFEFIKKNDAQAIEIVLYKSESKESRLQPNVAIKDVNMINVVK